jgi:hypothetical protein
VASHPAGVLATRLSADQPGKLDVKISLSRGQWVLAQSSAVNIGSSSVTLRANSGQSNGAITFTAEARILNTGGTCILKLKETISDYTQGLLPRVVMPYKSLAPQLSTYFLMRRALIVILASLAGKQNSKRNWTLLPQLDTVLQRTRLSRTSLVLWAVLV